MGVSTWTQWVFWQQCFLKPKRCKSLIKLFIKWYYGALQKFAHVTTFLFQVRGIKIWECSIFKIIPSHTCPCYLYHICLENRDSWYNVVHHVSFCSKLVWMSKRRMKIVTCHRSLYLEGCLTSQQCA